MLGLERQSVGEVGVEIGGALAGDPVQEIERDVAASGIAKSVHGPSDVVGRGAALEYGEQLRAEALCPERHAAHASGTKHLGQLGCDRLGVGLDRQLFRRRQRREQSRQLRSFGEGRSAAAEEHGLDALREHVPLERELGEQRVDVPRVLSTPPDHRHEVAVAAAVRAERQVHVEVPDSAHFFRSWSRLSTARNASCGTSTPPTCFMRFLPFFCFSSSFRLRVMSPP